MDELTKFADCKQEAKMLQLVNRLTLDVITKVLHPNLDTHVTVYSSLYCPGGVILSTAHRTVSSGILNGLLLFYCSFI